VKRFEVKEQKRRCLGWLLVVRCAGRSVALCGGWWMKKAREESSDFDFGPGSSRKKGVIYLQAP
jgi:hypothetical protein